MMYGRFGQGYPCLACSSGMAYKRPLYSAASVVADSAAPIAAAASADPSSDAATDALQPATSSSRRRKAGASKQPPALSCKRECTLFTGAFEDALLALKACLPPGYLQGKLEACLTGCLPPISTSLANILKYVAVWLTDCCHAPRGLLQRRKQSIPHTNMYQP